MSVNFYLANPDLSFQDEEGLHIGKSSNGLAFVWRGYEENEFPGVPELDTPEKWIKFLRENEKFQIVGEYRLTFSLAEFQERVKKEKTDKHQEDIDSKWWNYPGRKKRFEQSDMVFQWFC